MEANSKKYFIFQLFINPLFLAFFSFFATLTQNILKSAYLVQRQKDRKYFMRKIYFCLISLFFRLKNNLIQSQRKKIKQNKQNNIVKNIKKMLIKKCIKIHILKKWYVFRKSFNFELCIDEIKFFFAINIFSICYKSKITS